MEESLFKQLGGRPTLERVHKSFYDKMYADLQLKHYFEGIHQKTIEEQQTDFMKALMGGGDVFTGKLPKNCHQHMYITPELFERRMALYESSMQECGISASLAEQWIRLARACKNQVVKQDLSQCQKRYPFDKIILPKD